MIEQAKKIATEAHKNTKRKWGDEPYIVHPARCAAIAIRYNKPNELVAAMWLHDVIEDEGEQWAEPIQTQCGLIVLGLVRELTFPTEGPEWQGKLRAEKNKIREAQMRGMTALAKMGKMIDSIDNYNDMKCAPYKLISKTVDDGWRRYEILRWADESLAKELKEAIEKLQKRIS